MEHAKALAIKGIMTLAVLFIVLGLMFGMSFANVLLITVVLGLVSYFAGDLYILPKTNNVTATLSDLGMAFLVIWLLGVAVSSIGAGTLAGAAVITAVLLAVGENFFHDYLLKNYIGVNRRYTYSADH